MITTEQKEIFLAERARLMSDRTLLNHGGGVYIGGFSEKHQLKSQTADYRKTMLAVIDEKISFIDSQLGI